MKIKINLILIFLIGYNIAYSQECKHRYLDKACPTCSVQPGTDLYQCRKCNKIIELSSGDTLVLTDDKGDTLIATPIPQRGDYLGDATKKALLSAYEEYKVLCYNDSSEVIPLCSYRKPLYLHRPVEFEGFMEFLKNKK